MDLRQENAARKTKNSSEKMLPVSFCRNGMIVRTLPISFRALEPESGFCVSLPAANSGKPEENRATGNCKASGGSHRRAEIASSKIGEKLRAELKTDTVSRKG